MIKIKVTADLTKGDKLLGDAIAMLTGSEMSELNSVGGRAATNAAAKYHRSFDQSNGWRGKRFAGGSSEGSDFGSNVARAWMFDSSDPKGATIGNDADYYRFKVEGGTIRPKRAKALTIPMTPEAKGRRVRDYEIRYRTKLFRIKGKNALFERINEITRGSRGRRRQAGATEINRNQIRPVYALVKSVTQKPWPGALPPDQLLSDAFALEWRRAMDRRLEAM